MPTENQLDVTVEVAPGRNQANVIIDGRRTDIVVDVIRSSDGTVESFRPVTSQDSQRLNELTGVTVMSSDEVDDSDTEWTNEPGRTTESIGQIAQETGLTIEEVRDKIHEIKENLPRGTGQRNPDVAVDLDTGEVYPVASDGTLGDSIGNIYD